jgi:hypothetical protein
LDHRAHAAVHHQDAFGEQAMKGGNTFRASHGKAPLVHWKKVAEALFS